MAAERAFGEGLPKARHYADLLAGAGVQRGLIGPREVGRLWSRHLLNSVAIAELVPCASAVLDVGSGAGLPGIPLAIARPDLVVTLVESRSRPCIFLAECVHELDLTNVSVQRARVEEMKGVLDADVVTARAVGSLGRLWEWSAPLLRSGGYLLAIKGDRAEEELEAVIRGRLGDVHVELLRTGTAQLEHGTTVVRIFSG